MKARTTASCLALSCLAAVMLLSGALADAYPPPEPPGEVQKKVAEQAGGPQEPAAPDQAAPERPATPAEMAERIEALEKKNLVLSEDLGKARLDARTRLAEAEKRRAEDMARFKKKIEELNAQLAAERQRQSRKNKDLWLAVGILALGIIATN